MLFFRFKNISNRVTEYEYKDLEANIQKLFMVPEGESFKLEYEELDGEVCRVYHLERVFFKSGTKFCAKKVLGQIKGLKFGKRGCVGIIYFIFI